MSYCQENTGCWDEMTKRIRAPLSEVERHRPIPTPAPCLQEVWAVVGLQLAAPSASASAAKSHLPPRAALLKVMLFPRQFATSRERQGCKGTAISDGCRAPCWTDQGLSFSLCPTHHSPSFLYRCRSLRISCIPNSALLSNSRKSNLCPFSHSELDPYIYVIYIYIY